MNVEHLIIGGGGGGGSGQFHPSSCSGGGGGGGGVRLNSQTLAWNTSYPVVVGIAGDRGVGTSVFALYGGDSSFAGWSCPGGGAGGMGWPSRSGSGGEVGAAGGGGGTTSDGGGAGGAPTFSNWGGNGYTSGDERCAAGGGGGYSTAGGSGSGQTGKAGAGGQGYLSQFDGTYYYYGEGGSGGTGYTDGASPGGAGHGGVGGAGEYANGGWAPYPGTGCGGGGAGYRAQQGGMGQTGSVKIRYPGPQVCSGGTVTSWGGYTIHTFLSNGTFTTPAPPVPTITQIDNTTTGAVNDAVIVAGTTAYTHIWGTGLINGSYGTVSGTGVTAPFAAWSGDGTLIALNITAAIDAPLGARTITVTNANGTSNAMTLTVVAPVPTITAVGPIGAQSSAAGFIGIKERVAITGTGFIAPVTVNVSVGLTVTNVVLVSSTQINAEFMGTALGSMNVNVTTPGGNTGNIVFLVKAPVALPSAGMVIDQILGSLHNSHPGAMGMMFTIGAKDRFVTHLGRWKHSGDSRKHTLMLREGYGTAEVARVTIDMATAVVGEWNYVALPAPVKLVAGVYYVLADMTLVYNGDYFANVSPVAFDGNATGLATWVETSSMYTFTPAPTRSDPVSLGYRFIANGAYGTMALGRWKVPGNNKAHRMVLKDAAGTIIRSTTIDFTGGKGIDNAFNYGNFPYYALVAGAAYYVISDEGNGDAWLGDMSSITSPWSGLAVTGYAYEALPATNGVVPISGPTANQMYVGVDILCLTDAAVYSEAYVTVNLKTISAQQPMAMLI